MTSILIGLSGKIGSGKTTLANELAKEGFIKKSFAENLRKVCGILGGFNPEESRTADEKNIMIDGWNMTRGAFLQYIGTDVMRREYADVWVMSLMNEITNIEYVVIDDVRFPNEYDAIKKRGGICIRLSGDPQNIRTTSTRDLTHISETALDTYIFDLEINTNYLTIEQELTYVRNYITGVIIGD